MRIIRIIGVALGIAGLAASICAAIARRKNRYATKGL